MATTKTKNGAAPADTAFDQAREQSEQFLAVARKAGNLYLDAYETAVDRTIDRERKLAGLSRQEWLKNVIDTQTEIAREVTDAYATSARSLLK